MGMALWLVMLPLPQPVTKIVYVRPLTQWTCEAQEFAEHAYACGHRKISAKTGAKK